MENTQRRRTVRAFYNNPAYITTLRYTFLFCLAVYHVDCDVSILQHYHLLPVLIAPAQAVAEPIRSTLGFLHNSLAQRFPFAQRCLPPTRSTILKMEIEILFPVRQKWRQNEKLRPHFRTPYRQNFFPKSCAHVSLSQAYLALKDQVHILRDGATGRRQIFEGTNL